MAVSDREFATLAADLKHLTASADKTRTDLGVIDSKVDALIARFDRIDGGMKVAMAVSGFIGALSMLLLTKFLPVLLLGLPRI